MKKHKNDVNESLILSLCKYAKKHETGVISGFKHTSKCSIGALYSHEENMRRNMQLKAKIMMKGYGVIPIVSTYIESYKAANVCCVKKNSFFVVDLKNTGKLKQDLVELGEVFEQDSIAYFKTNGDYYLISSNDYTDAYPGYGKIGVEVKLGKSIFSQSGNFYFELNGGSFLFENFSVQPLEVLSNRFPTEIRSIKHYSECSIAH